MNKLIVTSLITLSVTGLIVACSGSAPDDLFNDPPPTTPPTYDASRPRTDAAVDSSMQDAATPPCVPEKDTQFCGRLAKDCGNVANFDNCGKSRTVNCGGCSSGQNCNNGACTAKPCVPDSDAKLCLALAKDCGKISGKSDNCGVLRTIDCGPENCGSAKKKVCTDNKCTCSPESDTEFCLRLGKDCGIIDAPGIADNCGVLRAPNCDVSNGCTANVDGFICASNVCSTCPSNGHACGGICTAQSVMACGPSCGVCQPDEACIVHKGGFYSCGGCNNPSQGVCNSKCVDITSNTNCGTCGTVCVAPNVCVFDGVTASCQIEVNN